MLFTITYIDDTLDKEHIHIEIVVSGYYSLYSVVRMLEVNMKYYKVMCNGTYVNQYWMKFDKYNTEWEYWCRTDSKWYDTIN